MAARPSTGLPGDAPADDDPREVLSALLASARRNRRYDIGYPGASDLTFEELGGWLTGQLLNNVGDPWDPGHGRNHTKALEQEVVDLLGDLFHAPAGRWGYVTTGATEGNLHAVADAAHRLPGLVVYASSDAHYSIPKTARLLRVPLVQVPAMPDGRMGLSALRREVALRRGRPALVVATVGTTMTEAVDDVPGIVRVLDDAGIAERRIHVDAALSGVPMALLPPGRRPAFDFAAGATSIVVSGHKFLSTLSPCGVLLHAEAPFSGGEHIHYTGSSDTTVTGSRSGHAPLRLWWVLATLGLNGLRARAESARALAGYTLDRLRGIGWPAFRNPEAFTVVLRTPPRPVLEKWVLAVEGDRAHVVCMPGVERGQIDEFVEDLRRATRSATRSATRVWAPDPRRRPAGPFLVDGGPDLGLPLPGRG